MKYVEKKMISCSNCKRCASASYPHGPYAYEVSGSRTKDRDNRKWRYLGKASSAGESAGGGKQGEDGLPTITGKLDVLPKTDDYERMGYEQRIVENKKKLLGAMPAAFPPEHSVRGCFAQACAEQEDEHAVVSGKVANAQAMRYIAEATRSDFAEAADAVLSEHGVSRIDQLPLDKEQHLVSLARRLYSEERSSIVSMQERSEKQYEHLRGVLREAGVGDMPDKVVQGKSELKRLQRHMRADIKKEAEGKTGAEKAAIRERIEGEYELQKREVRERIKEHRAKILEALEAAREKGGDGEKPPGPAKLAAAEDDPFTEDWGESGEEKSEEDLRRERYEAKLVRDMERADRSRVHTIIHDAGGLKTRADLREEYADVPNTFKRHDGLPGDVLAEYLASYHADLGIRDERDLISFLAA